MIRYFYVEELDWQVVAAPVLLLVAGSGLLLLDTAHAVSGLVRQTSGDRVYVVSQKEMCMRCHVRVMHLHVHVTYDIYIYMC